MSTVKIKLLSRTSLNFNIIYFARLEILDLDVKND